MTEEIKSGKDSCADFVKKHYKPGISPKYQLSNLSEFEQAEMMQDINSLLKQYSFWLLKSGKIDDLFESVDNTVKSYLK